MTDEFKNLDPFLLQNLMDQLIYELKEFLPDNLHSPTNQPRSIINEVAISAQCERALCAAGYAEKLWRNPSPDQFLTARQVSASRLLFYLSRFFYQQITASAINNFRTHLSLYLSFLSSQEAKSYQSMFDDKGINETISTSNHEGLEKHQEKAILKTINDLGYDPINLPKKPTGLPWVKSEVKNKLMPDRRPTSLFKDSNFSKTWQRLLDTDQIKENSEIPYDPTKTLK